jgi:UDP-sulfoquinovose synthase
MRILITGIDGYIGWPLTAYLVSRGHTIAGIDNFARRRWVEEIGGWSALPIASMSERIDGLADRFGQRISFWQGDLLDALFVESIVKEWRPEAIIHLGQCASAPYSMLDREHCMFVQMTNVVSTLNLLFAIKDHCPAAHLIKIGSMGEYGTPNVDIPEGFFEVEFRGRLDRLPFPRQANSWYHWSKVHDSNNMMFACRLWNIRATDIMQGTVFGTRPPEMVDEESTWSLTRLDFDQAFGTVINRFCCQAVIGHPLTIYGTGSQTRSFLTLGESIGCLELLLENPPNPGEYRVVNQFSYLFSIQELANMVRETSAKLGMNVECIHMENPRGEVEGHYYNPDNTTLRRLGHDPQIITADVIALMLQGLMLHRDRIVEKKHALLPTVLWGSRKEIA